MGGGDSGTKDLFFAWKSRLSTPNVLDWAFMSSPYKGIINSNKPIGVYTIAYTGGITYAGSAAENHRYQRPALYQKISDILT